MTSRLLSAAVGGMLVFVAAGCSDSPPTPPDARYTVRAELVRPPTPPSREIYLHHESIPDFRDLRGKHTGMTSMTMPFYLDEAIDASKLSPGERVEVEFEVRWNERAPLRVVRVEPLPPGTRLEFDPAPQEEEPAVAPAESSPANGATPR